MYTTHQMTEETGLSYRQIDYWCRRGIFGKGHEDFVGQGHRRVFTAEEQILARHLSVLTQIGLTPTDALKVVEESKELVSGEFQSVMPGPRGSVSLYWRLP